MSVKRENFDEVWNSLRGFKRDKEPAVVYCCEAAAEFDANAEEEFRTADLKQTRVAINQALLELQAHYWHWWMSVPKRHRQRVKAQDRCIFWVWGKRYWELEKLRKKIDPISSLNPPPPPPEPRIIGYGEALGVLRRD
jgi:hypothetical protein